MKQQQQQYLSQDTGIFCEGKAVIFMHKNNTTLLLLESSSI